MSLINAIILKARYKVLFDSFRKQVESSTLLSFLVISLIHFFLVKRNLQKNGNCGLPRATWHEGEAKPTASKKIFLMQEGMLYFLVDASHRRAV